MRNSVINVLAGLTIGASVAGLVALSAPTTVVGTAHAEPQVHVWPVGGVDVGDGPTARFNESAQLDPSNIVDLRGNSCWVEKAHSPATAEVICGDTGDRPRTDTADIGEVFGTSATECGWVASWGWRQGFDVAPAGCN